MSCSYDKYSLAFLRYYAMIEDTTGLELVNFAYTLSEPHVSRQWCIVLSLCPYPLIIFLSTIGITELTCGHVLDTMMYLIKNIILTTCMQYSAFQRITLKNTGRPGVLGTRLVGDCLSINDISFI